MSQTTTNSLSAYLTNIQNNNPYIDTDPYWRVFILDHKTYIQKNSNIVNVNKDLMTAYGYNPLRFLRSNGFDTRLYWIFLVINDIASESDFNIDMVSTVFYIPSTTLIQQLYIQYKSIVPLNS